MITEETIRKTMEKISSSNYLTTKQLNECGLTSRDLKYLVDSGFLSRKERGKYDLGYIEDFYNYASALYNNKEYDCAYTFLKKCYEIDPFYKNCAQMLAFICLKKEAIKELIPYLETLISTNKIDTLNLTRPLEPKIINELLKAQEYDVVINYYKSKSITKKLKSYEQNIIILINNIKDIKLTGKGKSKSKLSGNHITNAINNKKYNTALELAKEYNKKNNIPDEDSPYVTLLTEIIVLKQEKSSTLDMIINSLKNNKLEEFELLLNKYIPRDYKKLIILLAKIDLLEGDYNYEKTKETLCMIKQNHFFLKRTYYICKFKEELRANRYDNAEIYLEVIGCLEDIKEEYNVYKRLKDELNDQLGIKTQTFDYNSILKEKTYMAKQLSKLLHEKGLVLLKPMSKEERKTIYNQIKNMPNIEIFAVETGDKTEIALQYVSLSECDTKVLYKKAYGAYMHNQNNRAIKLFKILIKEGRGNQDVYYYLGELYLRKGNKQEALNYLKVAYKFAQNNVNRKNQTINSLEYIKKINYSIKQCEELSSQVDENKNESITEENILSNILYLIFEENYKIEEACNQYDLSEENTNYVRLICAIEEYRNLNYEKGDKLLKIVEKSKSKNTEIKRLFIEIQKNKLFYKNRIDLNYKNLSLKLFN